MRFHHRIRTIYTKELIDILRDRRTLIAMIVVPIVLYPLLMLGSIQAVSFQVSSMGRETIIIGVIDQAHGLALRNLIEIDSEALARVRAATPEKATDVPEPLTNVEIKALGSSAALGRRIAERSIQVGVIFDSPNLVNQPDVQNRIKLLADLEDVRGSRAVQRLEALIQRTKDRTNSRRKQEYNLPESFDQPFLVDIVDLSSPPSILGQVLPLILILMTITGAIYPAIDLTAGERERGTLESLMVCPVAVIDLIVGKFLVVTTVAIMGATLNLASVTATVYFGGFDVLLGSGRGGGRMPLATMALILACLVPFAVLMSAIMMAVCSYARTFKEAQNYVTPVILAVLIPGGIAALPATRLDGVMLVMPVGNMVLLARDLLLGAALPVWQLAMVLLSTTLYASAAVAVAATVFGKESVVFCDSASLKSSFDRKQIRPAPRPNVSMGLLVVALLFPVWFFIQSTLSPAAGEDASGMLVATGWLMPTLFVLMPATILLYWKIDIRATFALRMPPARHLAAGVLVGLSAWVPARELALLQQALLGLPPSAVQSADIMAATLRSMPPATVLLLIAVVPALCEELLFRGFLVSSVGAGRRKWTAIITSAAIFGVFHFLLFRFAVTAALGGLLAYLCWQSRSILPGVIAHFLNNTLGVVSIVNPRWLDPIGIDSQAESAHLPGLVLLVGGGILVAALFLAKGGAVKPTDWSLDAEVPAPPGAREGSS